MQLSKFMEQENLSVSTVADRLSVTPMAVRHWMNGSRLPRPGVMQRIQEVTNGEVTPNDFFASAEAP